MDFLSEQFYLLFQEAREKEKMDQNLYNSENTANFTSAYEAGSEEAQHAPFKMPVSISRRRPHRRSTPIPQIGFFEGIDRREATTLVRAQAYRDEYLGVPVSPEDAIIATIDGDIIETEEEANNVRTYFVDGLTDQERELVLKFGEEDPEPLHPTETKTVNLPPQETIERWEHIHAAGEHTDLMENLLASLRAQRDAEMECGTYQIIVPVKSKLDPSDRAEKLEARKASLEFQRNHERLNRRDCEQAIRRYRSVYGWRKPRFLNDREHRSTIRTENWAQQFVSSKWDLHDYLMEQWNEAELAYQDFIREFEEQRGAEAEAEFEAWEQEIEQAQRAQASEYEAETAEERRGEIEWQNERRRDFVRQYRYTSPRIDDVMRKALRDYDMECTIYHDMQNPIWDMYADLDYSPEQEMDLFLGAI